MFERFIDGYYDVECQLAEYLKNMAIEHFKCEEEEKDKIVSLDKHLKRINNIRNLFIDSIGGLDFEKTPLNATVTGVIDRDDYIIKKVIYESLPSFYVTSNLYIPKNISGKCPAILFACGHSEAAKGAPGYQKVCKQLALNGFVVLAVDPQGQGERLQYYIKDKDEFPVEWGVTEHSYSGVRCDLTGSNIARYFIWDLVRGIDYLETLPEVDKDRIGITGNSGGGTQTCYMMLIDNRLKAAAPGCYISSRLHYMKTGQAHDSEQTIYNSIAFGLNHDDFVTSFAPKPVMIGAARYDFFCVEGALQSFDRAKKIYKMYNSEDNLELVIAKAVHGYSETLRNSAVKFFCKHLKGQNEDVLLFKDIEVEDNKDLLCTKTGQVMKEFENSKSVFELNVDYLNKFKYDYTTDILKLRDNVLKVMKFPQELDNRPKIIERVISTETIHDKTYEKIFFFSEEDIVVDGIYISKGEEQKNTTILLMNDGTDDIKNHKELIDKLLENGDVFVFDPRGIGAAKSRIINNRDMDYNVYETEFKLNSDAIMMGTSLTALKVYDVLRAIDYINQRQEGKEISIAIKGDGAIWGLISALLYNDINKVFINDMVPSFEEVVTSKYFNIDTGKSIYGVLKNFDLPQIIDALKENKCEVIEV